jgi:hypothetical protein
MDVLDHSIDDVSINDIEIQSEEVPSVQQTEQIIPIDTAPTSESIQIAPTGATSELGDESNPNLFIQLGDDVMFESATYGRTIGTVYYRSLDMIHIKPDGVSNDVHRFEVEQTEDGEEKFKEEDDVRAVYILKKREFESFVEQQDLRVNQVIDTFDQERKPYKTYKIVAVDKENDKITIQDPEEENTEELEFNFIGIPSEKHNEFVVLRVRPMVFADEPSKEESIDDESEEPVKEPVEQDVVEADDLGIEEVGEIEIMRAKVYREAAAYEQRIPDAIQRVDALNDFISSLDPSLQSDPYAMRTIRILVETLFYLKQSTVAYELSGDIQGPKQLSASTLVDLIQRTNVPMGRPVLRISKKEYNVSEIEEENPVVDDVHFVDFMTELQQMNEKLTNLAIGDSKGKIVKEWQDERNFLTQFLSPWRPLGMDEPLWNAKSDSDLFRTSAPDGESTVPGYLASHMYDMPPIFHRVPFGLERALSTTYRKGNERRKEVLLEEDKATLNSYLLFPIRAAPYIGSTRSRSVAVDSGRSQLPPKTMKMLLEYLGNPTEMSATSNDIVLLNVVANTIGNIPLVDYIKGISMSALGLGDTIHILDQYGMENMELTPELATVLLEKITASQTQLRSSLGKLRKQITLMPSKEGEPNPLLESPNFLEEVQRQPILAKVLQEYEERNLSLAHSDLGKVIHLMKTHPNYFQISAGKDPMLMGKAFIEANRTNYLSQLMIERLIEMNKLNAGPRPRKNSCRHVLDLVSIRKIRDDSERFQELIKFFRTYQGERDQNWINCNVCSQHLLCCHERLQLQAFLNPREKDTLEKEIILMFAGGQFQGKYICRNCGQTMRDLDFDNNMEFDDNGKPKSGRSVLVDQDAIMEEKLDQSIGVPIEKSMKESMNLTASEGVFYEIIREISERVGINLEQQGYRNVIRGAKSWNDKFLDPQTYAKKQAASKGRMGDYKIAVARDIINACAVYLLIEIQTKIPAYTVRYALKGCKSPGFEGYPLDPNLGNQQGIQYIACAISSIRSKDMPWLSYQMIPDDNVRQDGIARTIVKIVDVIRTEDVIQAQLEEKRRYLLHVFGTSTMDENAHTKDVIPASFLPEQLILTPEEAAKQVINQEVVETLGNERARASLIKLWIRQAHAIAQRTAYLIRGTAFSETTCCLNSIQDPGAHWKSIGELPSLHRRTLHPLRQGQSLLTEFIPRPSELGVTEPNKELYFRLFLKCCFKGPRIGYSHQPGITNQCLWCGFQFPTHPSVMNSDTEGKAALADVKTDTSEFTELLDTIHNVNRVEGIQKRKISTVADCMTELINIQPMPIDNWDTLMGATSKRFMDLNHPDSTAEDFAVAAGELSNVTAEYRTQIERRIPFDSLHRIMEGITQLTWVDFFKALQTYFIIPFQRIVNNFPEDSFKIPIEMIKSLSEDHVEKDLQPILEKEMAFLHSNKGLISSDQLQFAKLKLDDCLKQFKQLLPFMDRIRPSVIPGRERSLMYIQQAFFYGPISMLIDPAHLPSTFGYQSTVSAMTDRSIEFLLKLVESNLRKYKRDTDSIPYDEQEIKNRIAVREEKERVNVIKEFDRLSDEERDMELTNKRLGLGKWAVGGTKLIYAYDKDYYDLERQKRIAAGIIDFPGHGNGEMNAPDGRAVDDLGFREYNDEEYEREGGYENNQHADDDYE